MKKFIVTLLAVSLLVVGGCGTKEEATTLKPAVTSSVEEAIETVVESTVEVMTEVEEAVTTEETFATLFEYKVGDSVTIPNENVMVKTDIMGMSMDAAFDGNIYYIKLGDSQMWVDVATLETYAVLGDAAYTCLQSPETFAVELESNSMVIEEVLCPAFDNGDGTATQEVSLSDDGSSLIGDLTYSTADGSFVSFTGSMEGMSYSVDTREEVPVIPEISFETITFDELSGMFLQPIGEDTADLIEDVITTE